MRLLITGACGFIGTNLVHRLLPTGSQLLLLDNQSAGKLTHLRELATPVRTNGASSLPEDAGPGAWFIEGDIRDRGLAHQAMAGVDAVIHLAAHTRVIDSIEQPWLDMEVNVQGTLNLLEAAQARGVKRFLFASSGAALGEQPPPIDESRPPRPTSPYGASKLAGEGYCSAFYRSFGLETVCLRFSNVYGPRSYHKGSVIAHFTKQVLSGKSLTVYGDGEQTRDFLFVEDLCDFVCACLSSEGSRVAGEVFQVATGCETPINEIAKAIQELGSRSGLKVEIFHEPARRGEVYRNYARIEKARRLLGYAPKTDMHDGIRRTWEWFRANWSEA